MNSLICMPDDVLRTIISFLLFADLRSLTVICKTFRRIIYDDRAWCQHRVYKYTSYYEAMRARLSHQYVRQSHLCGRRITGVPITELPKDVIFTGDVLSIHNTDLRKLPGVMTDRICDLFITNSLIDSITTKIGQYTGLICINLKNNKLTCIPNAILQLPQLNELNVSNNLITSVSIGHDSAASSCLNTLALDGNPIEALRLSCRVLSLLTLQHCDVARIHAQLNLPQLQIINMCHAGLSTVPAVLQQVNGITDVLLRSNTLTDLAGIEVCSRLRCLVVSNNQISNIDALAQLPSLRGLIIDDNRLMAIDNIGVLTNLRSLQVGSNQLTYLPDSINDLPLLELYIDKNEIYDMSNITHTSLQVLGVAGNAGIEKTINIPTLDQLETSTTDVSIDVTGLLAVYNTSIMEKVRGNMRILNVFHSIVALSCLPHTLHGLNIERSLLVADVPYVSFNHIINLQLNFCNLREIPYVAPTVVSMSLNDNNIKEITNIAHLTRLAELRLSDNCIKSVPIGINELTGLRRVYLFNNPIIDVDELRDEYPQCVM